MQSILFVGSLDPTSPDHEEFLQFCKNLGAGVADRYKVLICGTTPRTADHAITLGAMERLARSGTTLKECPRITLYHTEDDESRHARDNHLFEIFCNRNELTTRLLTFDSYDEAFKQAVRDCDIMTLVGGDKNSAKLVDLAIDNHKPVLGFTSFGGSGKQANLELKRVYKLIKAPPGKLAILDSKQMREYECSVYLDLVKFAHSHNPWASRNSIKRGIVLVSILMALLAVCVTCTVAPTLSVFPTKFPQYLALHIACIAMGLSGAYIGFMRQLETPSDLLLRKAIPATGQGAAIGFGIAAFIQAVIGFVLSQDIVAQDLSFVRLIGLSSLFSFGIAAFGVRGLKKIDEYLGNMPSLS